MRLLLVSFLSATILSGPLLAKDFGQKGSVFPIQEKNAMSALLEKLEAMTQDGSIDKLNQAFLEKVQQRFAEPEPVKGITRAKMDREFVYDPTIKVQQDLKDQYGKVFYKKGDKVNPLDTIMLPTNLLFLDERDAEQVDFVVEKLAENQTQKIILVAGSPERLENNLFLKGIETPVYFDQMGNNTKKLGIKSVPAIVKQDGLVLKINEINVKPKKERKT